MSYSQIRTHSATTCSSQSVIVVRERRSEYRVLNEGRKLICRTRVDGGLVVATGAQCCDYLMVDCPDRRAYFVELKGSDVFHAVEQISQTVSTLGPVLVGHSCFGRIVPTKVSVPDLRNDPKILRLEKMLRNLGGNLRIQATQMTEAY